MLQSLNDIDYCRSPQPNPIGMSGEVSTQTTSSLDPNGGVNIDFLNIDANMETRADSKKRNYSLN